MMTFPGPRAALTSTLPLPIFVKFGAPGHPRAIPGSRSKKPLSGGGGGAKDASGIVREELFVLTVVALQPVRCLMKASLQHLPHVPQSGHGWQADIWSLGCTVMEMLTAAPPFQHVSRSYMSLVHFIVDEKWEITVAPGLSQPVSEFMLAMLKRDPNQRGTALSFLRHPYLRDDANKLEPPISPLYALVRSLTAHDQERHRSDPEPASPKSQSPRPAPADHRGSVCDPQEEMARAAAQEAEREKEIAQQREQRDKEVCGGALRSRRERLVSALFSQSPSVCLHLFVLDVCLVQAGQRRQCEIAGKIRVDGTTVCVSKQFKGYLIVCLGAVGSGTLAVRGPTI